VPGVLRAEACDYCQFTKHLNGDAPMVGRSNVFRETICAVLLTMTLIGAQSNPAPAQDIGDPVVGRAIAQRWCDNCHVVDSDQQRATSTGAPTFAAIARMKSTTPMALRVFLQTPHGRMPDLHLTRSEIDDVSAYILSLKH
jgi:mono/diheme cytochrome c family protein